MKISGEIKGVGCDIVSISRVEKLIQSKSFLDKVYTLNEQNYIESKNAQRAAGLWAAKEAVSKALGTGFSGFTTKDIEIFHSENGQPYVVLYNGAKEMAIVHNIKRLHISISHEEEQAIALAVAE